MSEAEQHDGQLSIARDIVFRAGRTAEKERPLFLIVFYKHEAVKLSFLNILRQSLRDAGLSFQFFDPLQRPEHGTGRLYPLLADCAGSGALAIIGGIPRDQETPDSSTSFLDYLNLHRDRIARDRLRLILFLHSSEAERFMAGAGDLWDFRHHTYWLEGAPATGGEGLWQSLEQTPVDAQLSDQDREEIDNHLREIQALIDSTAEPDDMAALYLDLSKWLTRRNVPALGARTALLGLELLSEEPTQLQGELELELGNSLKKNNNYSGALTHYERSVAINREIGNRAGEGAALNNISLIYQAWGRYDEALKALEESLVICREISNRAGEGATLNNIAFIYRAWGRYDEALKMLEESLAISREIGDRSSEGTTLNNVSQIYLAWGRYNEALKTLEESLAISREIGNRADEGTALNNMSQIYRAWGRNDDALQTLEESLDIFREIGDRPGEGVTLNNIAQIYRVWGRNDEALKALEESLAISCEVGNRSGEGTICWNLALEYERRGDLVRAIDFARRSVEIEEELHHPDAQNSREYLLKLERK